MAYKVSLVYKAKHNSAHNQHLAYDLYLLRYVFIVVYALYCVKSKL